MVTADRGSFSEAQHNEERTAQVLLHRDVWSNEPNGDDPWTVRKAAEALRQDKGRDRHVGGGLQTRGGLPQLGPQSPQRIAWVF